MWELVGQFSLSLFAAVLAGDLLYLYYAGGWGEPNKLVRRSEVGLLFALVAGSVVNAVRLVVVLLSG